MKSGTLHFDTYNVERITLIGEHEEWSDSQ